MINANLVFGAESKVLRTVVSALCDLPGGLRPTRHSEGEDDFGKPIDDRFVNSLRSGPYLRGDGVDYDVWTPRGKAVEVMCYFTDPALAAPLLERMAMLNPVFGRACAWEELLHRNNVRTKLPQGTPSGWVGRDYNRWVPGLYWLTLLHEAFAERHGLPLEEVGKAALAHTALGGGQHLFRFHDHPEAWRERRRELDALCAALPGVFNIADVHARLAGVTDIKGWSEAIDPWSGWS